MTDAPDAPDGDADLRRRLAEKARALAAVLTRQADALPDAPLLATAEAARHLAQQVGHVEPNLPPYDADPTPGDIACGDAD